MITRQELEKMVEVEVMREFNGTNCTASNRNAFLYGAAFVMDKLMPEIEKLNEENKLIYNLLQIQELSRDLQRICDRTQTPPERGEE